MQVLYNILLIWVIVGVVLATISVTFLNLDVDKASKYLNIKDEVFNNFYLKMKMQYDKQSFFKKCVEWCSAVVVSPLLVAIVISTVIISGVKSVFGKKGGAV